MSQPELGQPTTLITIEGKSYPVIGYNFTANWAQLVFPDASTLSINITNVAQITTEIIPSLEESVEES